MPTHTIPVEMRDAVAEALHQAVSEFMHPSIHHAAALNTIGCYLLCHLTSAQYETVAGSIVVRQGGTPVALRADPARVDEHEYYVWIALPLADGQVELVDFASGCWMDWARDEQILWIGPPPPAYVWTLESTLDPAMARYTADTQITLMVRKALHNVFRSENPPEQVKDWERAINTALDILVADPRAIDFLVAAGIAER